MNLPLDTIGVGDLTFTVLGTPQQQGSFIPGVRKDGAPFLRPDNPKRLQNWRNAVTQAAYDALDGRAGYGDAPVEVWCTWVFARIQRLKPTDPLVMSTRPDGDKLTRAVWDALTTAGVIADDARIARWHGAKRYSTGEPGDPPGVHVKIARLAL